MFVLAQFRLFFPEPSSFQACSCWRACISEGGLARCRSDSQTSQLAACEEKKRMTIRLYFRIVYGVVAWLLAAFGTLAILLYINQVELNRRQTNRFECVTLARWLQTSSEELTRFARTYVATGNPRFEQFYWDLLDIRNGNKPRPSDETGVYWHLLESGAIQPVADGDRLSLDDRMAKLGLVESELRLLEEAKRESDVLVRTEEIAMHAMKGEFEDEGGAFSRTGPPDPAFAVRILFDEAYLSAKGRIMAPIGEFHRMLNARTQAAVEDCFHQSLFYIRILFALLALVVVLGVVSLIRVHRRMIYPVSVLRRQTGMVAADIQRLAKMTRNIAQGDLNQSFQMESSPMGLDSTDEIGILGRLHDEMREHLQETGNAIAKVTAGIRKKEERFRAIADYTFDWENWVGPDLKTIWTNPAVERMTGYALAEYMAIPNAPVPLIHPDDLPVITQARDAALKGIGTPNVEFRLRCKDGSMKWGMSSYHPIYDDRGNSLGYRSSVRDITARKQAEEALSKSEEQVRLLLNSTAEAIYGLDLQGNCTFANPACTQMLGYPGPDALLGKNMHNLMHYAFPDGRPMPIEICRVRQAFLEGKGTHVDDEVLWRADGTCFPAEYWSYPQMSGGKIVGSVVAFLDITERKKAQAEREQLIADLRRSFSEIKTLQGLVPICSNCKKIRDDTGFWQQVEQYVGARTEARFSHGICPECVRKIYPDMADDILADDADDSGFPDCTCPR